MEHNVTSPAQTSPLSVPDQHLLDVVKDAFRSSWNAGGRLRIEALWQGLPETLKPAALHELLLLEIGVRRAAGETPSAADYIERFPEHRLTLAALFDEPAGSPSAPAGDATILEPSLDTVIETPAGGDPAGVQGPAVDHVQNPGPDGLQHAATKSGTASLDVPEQFGRYRILRELGRGGMGAVFLAHDRQLDRQVALKIPFFRDNDDEDAVERFYREARAMATVQHANLCPVFDVGQFERWHFLTMAYIDGQTLAGKLKEAGALTVMQAVALLKTVAIALQKAHVAGVVHRDLKPSNIMLTRDLEPIIMDFGLARRKRAGEAELTQRGEVFGSPAYMAPEQVEARHDEIGPTTDVYALGVILYQMVVGRRPFEGSQMSIFGQIVSNPPAPPSQFRPELSHEIDAVCLKALSKEPSQRHASAAEFADALSRISDNGGGETPTTSYVPPLTSEAFAASESDAPSGSRSRRDAELRLVTVAVFNYEIDDGSISTSSASYSELLHEQSQLFASFVNERVAKWGGATVSSSGQEVMACFGFPETYEDAPQRAVRAALQILRDLPGDGVKNTTLPGAAQAWGVIHSGEAVAEVLDDSRGSGISLVGEARNVVTRLGAIAQPGAIVISAAARQRTALFFECESLGVQRLRGMAQPVELFRVIREAASRNRVELVDPGNLAPLVGRDTELQILKDRWEQALDELGQIVLLIGDAGLGKSRLIRELREHVLGLGDEGAAVIELRCSQYHQNTSYYPLVDFLSRMLSFENQPAVERLESIVRYLRELKLDLPENVALFCNMLGVAGDGRFPALALSAQRLKERTEELLLRWLKQLVAVGPVLFIVEDLHWVDPSTVELLERHVTQFETGRILSLLTFRPEFETPWKSKPHQTQIALSRLTKRQIGEMIRTLTKRREIPDAILQQVIARTDGIPLFVEEFSNVIVESGVLDRAQAGADHSSLLNVIPATLNDLLIARLDRMAADREVIQLSATIGREFTFQLLAAACTLPEKELQTELDKLVKAEILFKKGEAAAASYIFKHALLQDAAYRSMLTKKRQACHQRIAEILESRFTEIAASQPALLAQHFTEAGNADKAIEYWLKAGQKSQEQSANVEAIQQFRRGIELTLARPTSQQRDMQELSLKVPLSAVLMAVAGYGASEVEPVQDRCIEICRQIGAGAPLFPLLIANWEWLFIRGRFRNCYERAEEVIALAEADQQPGMMAEAHWTHVCTSMYAGDFEAARDHARIGWQHYHREASIEYAKITQQNSGPLNLSHLGMALWQLGYPDQGFARLREALDLAYDLKHVFTQAVIEWKVGQAYDFAEIGDKAIEHGERCRRIADEHAFAFWVAMANGCVGVGLKQQGRFDEAVETLQTAIAQLEATGACIVFPKYKGHLADALWQTGRRDAAAAKLGEAFADQATGEYYMHAELLRIRGDFEFDAGEPDRAEATYLEALAVAARQNARMYELRTTLHLCRLWKKRGQLAEARRQLEPLSAWFTEGFEMPDLRAARAFLDEL